MTKLIVPSFCDKFGFGDKLCLVARIEQLHNEGNDVWIGDFDTPEINKKYLDLFNLYKLNWKYQIANTRNFNKKWPKYPQIFHIPSPPPVYQHDATKIYKMITFSKTPWYKSVYKKMDPTWNMWNYSGICGSKWIEINQNIGNTLECERLIAESDLFIAPDTGPAHLAKATGTPMILLEYPKYNHNVEWYFPPNIVNYTKATTNEEVIKLICQFYLNTKLN